MLTALRVVALAAPLAALAGCPTDTRSPATRATVPAPCASELTIGSVQRLGETTDNRVSGRDIKITDVYARSLADASGQEGMRMSAVLIIHDPQTDEIVRPTVMPGSVIEVGGDHYCVVDVVAGYDQPGSVGLVRLRT